jgi:signal transduction histidine kinase
MADAIDSRGSYFEEFARLIASRGDLSDRAEAVVSAARGHAEAVIAAGGGAPDATRAGLVNFVADVLNGLWLERHWRAGDVHGLLESIAEVTGMPMEFVATAVALRALSQPSMLELPPSTAIEAQLGMLSAFAPVTAVSLWTREMAGPLRCVIHHGSGAPTRRMRAVAVDALSGVVVSGLLQAVPVMRWEEPRAALVARAATRGQRQCLVCLEEAAATLGPVLERQAILDQSAEREHSLVQASERALVRVGFDLHDGPIQDISALGFELVSFRQQLAGALGQGGRTCELLLGRLDDIHARLVALDDGVRDLARSLNAPALGKRPLIEALSVELDTFRTASGIPAKLTVDGDVDVLTPSQRIALLRITHEALNNVREHGGASKVVVHVSASRGHVRATIQDDGGGFDVQSILSDASRRGRLGLVGMRERARLLGGSCSIRSSMGGPTVVSVALPRWDPAPAPKLSNTSSESRGNAPRPGGTDHARLKSRDGRSLR